MHDLLRTHSFSPSHTRLRFCLALTALLAAGHGLAIAQAKWQTPTAEELAMTSQPQVPGAAAVYLYREDSNDDDINHPNHIVYVRLKVLTEAGKSYADVELPYVANTDMRGIEGRTIQPDGTVVPFTGKPFTKTMVRNKNMKVDAKVFTLPAVTVGSILEYRYEYIHEGLAFPPTWLVQEPLYIRKAHFVWKPANGGNFGSYFVTDDNGGVADHLAWASNLPDGAKVQVQTIHARTHDDITYTLDVHDIAPLASEEDMPPLNSVSQRVQFYYTGAFSQEDYWKEAGKRWSKKANTFIGPGKGVAAEVARVVSPGDSADDKLRKIYEDVMSLDNWDFTREKDKREAKVEKSADDVLDQKGGSGYSLTMLFIAMARQAGFKAYAVAVANREENLFWPALLQFQQLQDSLAIVQVDGKDQYFDPAARYCPYGLLKWGDSVSGGYRQMDGNNVEQIETPQNVYLKTQVQRMADLKLAADGSVTGTIKLSWTGLAGMQWRQMLLREDMTETQHAIKESIEREIPKGLKLELDSVKYADQMEMPFVANYKVEGQLAEATSKRLILPAQFFQSNASPRFSAALRTVPVDLRYGHRTADSCRITLPDNMHWEEGPKPEKLKLNDGALYASAYDVSGNTVTMRRQLDIGKIFYSAAQYSDLHDFFSKVATADSAQAVIGLAPATGSAAHGQ